MHELNFITFHTQPMIALTTSKYSAVGFASEDATTHEGQSLMSLHKLSGSTGRSGLQTATDFIDA